ncbi:MAG: DUF3847 domain-containing protein, partial [Acutalibacteraceae bacterium]
RYCSTRAAELFILVRRIHRLCEKGGAIESVCPETKEMTSAEFYQFAEFVFGLPEVKKFIERSIR